MKKQTLYKYCNILLLLSVILANLSATAATNKLKKYKVATLSRPISASLVVDSKTGEILHFDKADSKIFPASLTKVMTLYLTFEAIENHRLRLNDHARVSKAAAAMPAMKLGLKEGEHVKIKDMIMAVALNSANDAARVLAETISGTEELFAKKMNIRAKQLGMHYTTFKNASGWHHPQQHTSAVDIAKLAIAIKRDFPSFYPIFAKTAFDFKGRTIQSHNYVTRNYLGAEGLKTGYTSPSGFNLVTSATKNGRKLVAVVIGGKTAQSRDNKMMYLLDKHFGVNSQTTMLNNNVAVELSKTNSKNIVVLKSASVKKNIIRKKLRSKIPKTTI